MADIKKVIKGLEICSEHGSWHGLDCELNEAYKDCPYHGCETGCVVTIAKDAIALLKEQKAIRPKIDAFGHPYCPKCKILVYETWEFCPHCGQEMEW